MGSKSPAHLGFVPSSSGSTVASEMTTGDGGTGGSMRTSLRHRRWLPVACVVAFSVAACSSGSSTSAKPPAAATPGGSGAAAASAIAANWAAFFNASTPAAKRISLLQDGQAFASFIKAESSSGLASEASAKVSKVTVTKPAAQAAVSYSILLSGKPVLSGQSGMAVYQDGTWKVGATSFCGLLALEDGGSTQSLPAACSATS
jgi:hypothetical protein